MNAIVTTPGVHGYSSPCPDHVVFSISHDIWQLLCCNSTFLQLCAPHLIIGRGSWEGVEEPAYALPKEVYLEMNRIMPIVMRDQDYVLVLGTPESQNWRPATLCTPELLDPVDNGTWLEATEQEARTQDGWSFFNGHWFICEDDPADSIGTAEERLLEAKAAAMHVRYYDKVVAIWKM